jgi:hypothetical protein
MSEQKPDGDQGRDKGLWHRLKSIFNKQASPAVPRKVVKDKKIRRAIRRDKIKKRLKVMFGVAVASTAISTATHLRPDLVSTTFEDHLKQKQIDPSLVDHFHAQNIRVYDRWNPLMPFHLAAQAVKLQWQESDSPISSVIGTPFAYATGMWMGAQHILLPIHSLDAYSIAGSGDPKDRDVWIRPPADFTLNEFMSGLAKVEISNVQVKSDKKELEKFLYTYVMLHEARHGDQIKAINTAANESDADLYALTILALKTENMDLFNEAYQIIQASRVMSSVIGGGETHSTGASILRGYQTPVGAFQDSSALKRLHDVVSEIDKINGHAFGGNDARGNRMIYITGALLTQGWLENDPELKQAAVLFLRSSFYVNELSGGRLVDFSFDMNKILIAPMFMPYVPVENKLPPVPEDLLEQLKPSAPPQPSKTPGASLT